MSLILTDDANNKLVNQAVASGGPFNGTHLELFTNVGLAPDNQTVYSDLTPPSYTGYARQAVTFSSPVRLIDDSYAVLGNRVDNICTAEGTSATITGMALTSGVSVIVLEAVEVFATPVSVALPGDFVSVVPMVQIPASAYYGQATQII